MIRRPPRSTLDRSSAASDVYKRQGTERQDCSAGWDAGNAVEGMDEARSNSARFRRRHRDRRRSENRAAANIRDAARLGVGLGHWMDRKRYPNGGSGKDKGGTV